MPVSHVVVLLSGGLDSAVLLADQLARGRRVTAASFEYGARHNARELACAKAICEAYGVRRLCMSLGFIGELYRSSLLSSGDGEIPMTRYDGASMARTVVPFRNGVMLAAAAGLAESIGADAVAIAAHGGDHEIYPDCRPEFLHAMGEAIRLGTDAQIALLRPFAEISKTDIVRRGAELNVDFAGTWSCYVGGEAHCGRCGTCRERREAFAKAGVRDPTTYAGQDGPARPLEGNGQTPAEKCTI